MNEVLVDVRHAGRTLGRNLGFTTIAALTIALGIGTTVAMFAVVNAVLLRPLAYSEPDRLYSVRTVVPFIETDDGPVNARHFYEWRMGCRSCEDIALVGGSGFTLSGDGEPERLPGLEVSFDFFRTLGVLPAMGRDFVADDEGRGRTRVAILSDAVWRRRFAADPAVVGRNIVVNGEPAEVIGIMGPALRLPRGEQWGSLFAHAERPEIFLPFGRDFASVRGAGNFNYAALVRVRREVTPAQASDEMTAVIAGFSRQFNVDMRIRLVPLRDQVTSGASGRLWLLMGAVVAVLLIVCVNIGNLMLVRSTSRHREVGIRLAMGATRATVFRLVLTEVCLLVVLGGSLGLLLANTGIQAFVAAAPLDLPRIDEVGMDWRVFAFGGLAAAWSALVCGLLPAWRLSRTELNESLKASSPSTTDGRGKLRFGDALVGVEVAATALLLIIGGLLIVSFVQVLRVETGFEGQRVVTIDVPISQQLPRYSEIDARNRFVEQALVALRGVRAVEAVGVTTSLPLQGETWIDDVADADNLPVGREPIPVANYRFVSPGYWQAMGIALRQGRYLEESDRNRQVAVISEQVATRLWPSGSPIGKRLKRGLPQQPVLVEVIGVVADVRADLEQQAPMTVYEPYWTIGPGGPTFVVRTSSDPTIVISEIRSVFSSLDPQLPLRPARTMEQIISASVEGRRFQTSLAAAFAVSALLLASLGIYGVISFSVMRRTRELGLRTALGAEPRQILSMVLRQGMVPVATGLFCGTIGAAVVGRVLGSQLYGVSPYDPLTFVAAVAVLAAVAGTACWLPARRAARVGPLVALRYE